MKDIQKDNKQKLVGKVVSDARDKTVTISVERVVKHPIYKKSMKRYSKFHAHDEKNECKLGDVIEVVSCRPISKQKCWNFSRKI